MTIKLAKVAEKFVKKKLDNGEYKSAAAVVGSAIRMMQRDEKMRASAKKALLREVDAGLLDIEEGRVIDWDPESLKRDLLSKARKAS